MMNARDMSWFAIPLLDGVEATLLLMGANCRWRGMLRFHQRTLVTSQPP